MNPNFLLTLLSLLVGVQSLPLHPRTRIQQLLKPPILVLSPPSPNNAHQHTQEKQQHRQQLLIENGFPQLPGGLSSSLSDTVKNLKDKAVSGLKAMATDAINAVKSIAVGLVKSVLKKIPFGNILEGLFEEFLSGPPSTQPLPPTVAREDPTQCPYRCFGRGRCLENLIKTAESTRGVIFECNCFTGWTGGACHIPEDQFYLWAISVGIDVSRFTGSLPSSSTSATSTSTSTAIAPPDVFSGYGYAPPPPPVTPRPPCCPVCTSFSHPPSRLYGISYSDPFEANEECARRLQKEEEKLVPHHSLDPFSNGNQLPQNSAEMTEDANCSITPDITKANSACCVYCSFFGFGDEEQSENEALSGADEIVDWSNPIDLASAFQPDSIALAVGLTGSSFDAIMRHKWLRQQARSGNEDSDECCVICPYTPTSLHVYAVPDSSGGFNFRRCCPACPTQFVILLNNYESPEATSSSSS